MIALEAQKNSKWFIFFAIVLIAVVFWVYVFWSQTKTIKSYRKIGKISQLLEKKNEVETLLANEKDFLSNYIPADENDKGLLTKIGQMNKNYAVKFLSIGPIDRVVFNNYIKSSRTISFESDYPEAVKFLNNIEKVKGINISNLSIRPTSNKKHVFNLEINNFYLKENLSSNKNLSEISETSESEKRIKQQAIHAQSLLLTLPTNNGIPTVGLMQKLVSRDPFSINMDTPAEDKKYAAETTQTDKLPSAVNPVQKTGFYLGGIIEYDEYSIAFIQQSEGTIRMIRKGEMINGHRIESIKSSDMTISRKGETKVVSVGEMFF